MLPAKAKISGSSNVACFFCPVRSQRLKSRRDSFKSTGYPPCNTKVDVLAVLAPDFIEKRKVHLPDPEVKKGII